jgi:hypothetical protein
LWCQADVLDQWGEDVFKSPIQKLARFFERSRNGWKAKCQAAKAGCKRWANQARAVARSRDQWRRRAEGRERELAALQEELAALQKTVCG